MRCYLNTVDSYELYERETKKPYFVDKTKLLEKLFPLVEQGGSNIAVTRPRRFGKSITAEMIASFFNRGMDSSEVFSKLEIAQTTGFEKHMNQHNVIYINFSKGPDDCTSYDDYISYIKEGLVGDIEETYPDAVHRRGDSVGAMLRNVSAKYQGEKFILVFDEWDYIFHRPYFTETDRGRFTAFLGDLTKDRPYIEMTYITGILPIKKYSGSDTMNHFAEYNMANDSAFDEYFGFTGKEVDELYHRYLENTQAPAFTREKLEDWYDGYHNDNGLSLYNPNSVVFAFSENRIGNYWSKAGEYEELKDYVLNDIDGVKEAVMMLAADEQVQVDISEYATTAQTLERKDEILSAMTVYGYLNYHDGCVRIPNMELQTEFDRIMRTAPRYNYMRKLEKESERILAATYQADTDTIAEVLAFVHNSESPLKYYDNEAELSGSVKLAYIAARNKYDIQREDQAGTGYVDYIFYPYNHSDDGIILELKVNASPETALKQIKQKKYAMKFQGKLGEMPKTTGRIILVGIGYYKKSKQHRCKIEILNSLQV
ncbi:MAG: ATP-binding protein [Lachnospiraceae bacterium]|nr:ATP-binding protein [Lachnospiraceae bacterium]